MTRNKIHTYQPTIHWKGNLGSGTQKYDAYSRDYEMSIEGKPNILGSSDPAFRGDASRHNPEDLFVASVASCHMLWYLHLCAEANIIVKDYSDHPIGLMDEGTSTSPGEFKEITLNPKVVLSSGDKIKAEELHDKAHKLCYIANSIRTPVKIIASIIFDQRKAK